MAAPVHNHVFNHVAVSVADCDKAVEWYGEVFGFRRIRGDATTERSTNAEAPMFKIYDNKLRKVKVAWLGTGNSVGFEVFEFIEPEHQPKQSSEFEYTKSGFFHIAITAPDPDATCKKAVELGGKQIGETVSFGQDSALYLADPWGNVVEVLSCSFEHLLANR